MDYIEINENIQNFIKSKSYRHYKIMYHITKHDRAKDIMKNGFDISLQKHFSLGRGINLTDEMEFLEKFSSDTYNTVIMCIVRYNKLKLNTSYPADRKFLETHGYTKPKYMNVPSGYDGFKAHISPIYVIKNKSNVHPLCIFPFSKTK